MTSNKQAPIRTKFAIHLIALLAFSAVVERDVSAQTAQRNSGAANLGNQALAQDVTRPFGEYKYVPQTGLYKDVTLGDIADDLRDGVGSVGQFLNKINLAAGWSQVNPDGFSTAAMAGVGPFRLPSAGIFYGSPYYGSSANGLRFMAGPLMIDDIYLGYGLLYSDIQGQFPGREGLAPDDRWGQMVTLNFRASLAIGNSIGVSIQPYLYYLPEYGKIGWGVPGPIGTFLGYQPNAIALFQIAWRKQVGNWDFTIYDAFDPRIYQYNVWDVLLSSQAQFGNLTPIERVGRYSLGYGGGGDLNNYNPQARAGVHPSNWNGVAGYYNIFGVRAQNIISPTVKSLYYLFRNTYWDSRFRNVSNSDIIVGGAYIQAGDPYFTTYAGYNFASFQPFNSFMHWAVVGAKKQLGPAFTLYGQGGYAWWTGDLDGPSGSLYTVGLQQQLGQRTAQYFEVGRRVFTPVTGPYGIENYVDYRINHMLGVRNNITGFIGMSDRKTVPGGNNQVFKYTGLMLNSMVSMRLTAFASSGWSNTESGIDPFIYDDWTHRFGLRYNATQNIQTQAFYQYQEVSTNSAAINYSEHYIYLGVTKRF